LIALNITLYPPELFSLTWRGKINTQKKIFMLNNELSDAKSQLSQHMVYWSCLMQL